MENVYGNVASVEVDNHRWNSRVTLRDQNGEIIEVLVFSADSGYTYNDGIWAGTLEEYKTALD